MMMSLGHIVQSVSDFDWTRIVIDYACHAISQYSYLTLLTSKDFLKFEINDAFNNAIILLQKKTCVFFSSRKHTYIILTPLNPNFI